MCSLKAIATLTVAPDTRDYQKNDAVIIVVCHSKFTFARAFALQCSPIHSFISIRIDSSFPIEQQKGKKENEGGSESFRLPPVRDII